MIRRLAAAALGVALAAAATACAPGSENGPTNAATGTAMSVPSPSAPVYLIGDSWAAGVGADPGSGWVDLIGARYGWDLTVNAQPGTGYEAVLAETGQPFIERVAALPAESPELVIVQGGLNDEWAGWMHIDDDAEATIEAIQTRYPNTPVVIVGPATAKLPITKALASIDEQLEQVAGATSAVYVSPIQGEWVNDSNLASFIDPVSKHPSNEGHAEYAARLTAAISAATG